MRITSRGFAAVTVGLVSAVLLSGCSSNSNKPTVLPSLQSTTATPSPVPTSPAPAPSTTAAPTTQATATATASPTTSAPTITASSNPVLAAAAKAFVENYYKTAAAALHDSTALTRWKTLFISTCTICSGDYAAISHALAAGDHYDGGEYRLQSAKVKNVSSDGALVDITFYVTAAKVTDASGHLIVQQAKTKLRHGTVGAARAQGHWLVTQIHDDAA